MNLDDVFVTDAGCGADFLNEALDQSGSMQSLATGS